MMSALVFGKLALRIWKKGLENVNKITNNSIKDQNLILRMPINSLDENNLKSGSYLISDLIFN